MGWLYEALWWLAYALAAVVMLAAAVSAVLAGLGLKPVAEFLLELGEDGGGDTVHARQPPANDGEGGHEDKTRTDAGR